MASWFKSRRSPVEVPRLKPRSDHAVVPRVNLGEIAPDLLPYLGQAAYLQLEAFQTLSRVIPALGDVAAKEDVASAAGLTLAKFQGLTAEIRRRGSDPDEVMRPFAPAIDRFQSITTGSDWRETLLGVYLTSGLLDDFFIRLAEGLSDDVGPRAAHLVGADAGSDAIQRLLKAELASDSALGSRLAMWGRRLVGDTLLVARSALHGTGNVSSDEQRIEPVFTDIIAAHTRRMDALGLTA